MGDILSSAPAHVPSDRVDDFDIYAVGSSGGDYFEDWRALQGAGKPDIIWSRRHGGHWIVTRGSEIHRLIGDTEHLSNSILTVPTEISEIAQMIPLQCDPPAHAAYRTPITQSLSAKNILKLEPVIRGLTRRMIAEIRPKGVCEFVTEFGEIIPIEVFLTLVGLPVEDRARLRAFGEQLNRPDGSMTAQELIEQVTRYLEPYVSARLLRPGDDLFSRILAVPVFGRPWSEEEAMRMCRNLLFGGLDTVAAMLGLIMYYLARQPEQRALLRDRRDVIPRAADEFLRRFGSVTLGRVAVRDFLVDGITIKAGDVILFPTTLHNLDERSFDSPTTVDFNRGIVRHSTMGNGAHRCVGATLARFEIIAFLEEWLSAIPEFSLDPSRGVRMRGGGVGSLLTLPLRWTP